MRKEVCGISGYQRLSVAVVKQAVTDYEIALKKLKRNRKDIWASQMRNDCERFFEDEISMYTDIDGKAIMDAIKKRVGWLSMDRSIFSRYKRNKRELVLLEKAIEKLENRLKDVPIVNGKVSGSSKNFPYIETHMTVQMAEPKAADEISARLRDKIVRRDVVLKEIAEVEAFISKMPDGEKKEIFSMFYLDGVSQREIADSVGYTQARVSQIINTV